MVKPPLGHLPPKTDLRAPRRFQWLNVEGWPWERVILLVLTDIFAIALAWQGARYLNKFYSPIPEALVWWEWFHVPSLFWVFCGLIMLFFAYGGLYRLSLEGQNYVKAAQLSSLVYLLALVLSYFYDPQIDFPRSLFMSAWFGSVLLIISFRVVLILLLRQFNGGGQPTKIFIIAPAARVRALAQAIAQKPHYRVVGAALSNTINSKITLEAIFQSQAAEVLVADIPEINLASTLYWQLRRWNIGLRLLPSSREILYRRGIPEIMAGMPTLRVEIPLLLGWDYRVKRWIDVIGATVGLILISPLLLGVVIAIKLSSPGPVFFRQERIGLHGKVFKMWKFRTMIPQAEQLQKTLEQHNQSQDGIMFKIKDDPRLTPIGKFLRQTSIDELPQLFNVVLGQMSLVGPRPLPLRDVQRFESWHHIRHYVVPGITGLWQISGRSEITDFSQAARLDLYYIDNWSLNLDLDILIETIRIVFFGRGAY